MINATTLNKIAKESLPYDEVVNCPGFKAVMDSLEREMAKAAEAGKTCIEVVVYCLDVVLSARNLDRFYDIGNVKHKYLDSDFLWAYVRPELEKAGFKILPTLTSEHYLVSWNNG